jgi:hypothetical protein
VGTAAPWQAVAVRREVWLPVGGEGQGGRPAHQGIQRRPDLDGLVMRPVTIRDRVGHRTRPSPTCQHASQHLSAATRAVNSLRPTQKSSCDKALAPSSLPTALNMHRS